MCSCPNGVIDAPCRGGLLQCGEEGFQRQLRVRTPVSSPELCDEYCLCLLYTSDAADE